MCSDKLQARFGGGLGEKAIRTSLVAYPTRQRVQQGPPQRPALWPVLQRLPCPTLVVWGMESDVLSEAQARRVVDVMPRGELVAVPGVGHAPTLLEPVALAALERFLSGRESVAS